MITTPQSVGVYVHLPWCIHKCPYCDFNSHEASQEKVRSLEEEYVDTLIEEFNFYQDLIKERIITSIFFGGGTPSLSLASISISEVVAHLNFVMPCFF